MIVGCYSLDLYCRHDSLPIYYGQSASNVPPGHHMWDEFPHTFDGKNERVCMAEARRRGWKFRDGDAVCPRCARKPHPQGAK